eukprot:Sspe_Gene.2178::Locus_718_Transcript_1_1_Confidence_1.000_Length_659::g.2178::m.2178/K00799/GST, gst; glutathione S-transferase
MKVGMARKQYKVDLPKMYAEGDSKDAKLFNCIQRGHQQALETYPQFLALSLIAGLRHPVFSTLCGLAWCIARVKWAAGYATGDPEARYSSFWGAYIWYALIGALTASFSSTARIAGLC